MGPQFLHQAVVVLSASPDCPWSPADELAGGDYDGDNILVISHRPIVEAFAGCPVDRKAQAEVETLVNSIAQDSDAPASCNIEQDHYLLDEHWLGFENSILTARMADWWTAIADEKGVKHPHAVTIGLLHQLALDSKIPCDKVPREEFVTQVCKRLGIGPPDTVAMPHWHTRTATNNGCVRQSSTTLGRLQNEFIPENLASSWKKEYGGNVYQAILKGMPLSEKPPCSLKWPRFEDFLDAARVDLMDYLRTCEKANCSEVRAAYRERYLQRLPAGSDDLKRAYATAFYCAQYEHFWREATSNKVHREEQLEKLLLPAWELFLDELCHVYIACTSDRMCLMSQEQRGRVQYRS